MANKSNSQRLAEFRSKKKEEEKKSSSSSGLSSNSDRLGKIRLENTIGLDTFETDLKNVGATISGIYNGWQTTETMANTRATVESMQKRINAYQTYQKKYGGADLSDIASGYQTVLDDWDNLTSLYGQYKNADAFNTAKKRTELDKQFKGLTYDEVQSKKKNYKEDTDEYKYLSEYTGYSDLNDFDRAIEEAKKNGAKKTEYTRAELGRALKSGTKLEESNTFLDQLETAKNKHKLDNGVNDYYEQYREEKDFEELSQYKQTELEGWWDKLNNGDYGLGYGDVTYEYINNVDGARDKIKQKKRVYGSDSKDTTTSQEKKGYDELTPEEIQMYNYLYAKDRKLAEKYLEEMEVVLSKRVYDKSSSGVDGTSGWKGFADKHPVISSALSTPMNIMGGFTGAVDTVKDIAQGKEYNPYGYYKAPSNFASDTREVVGENIAENTDWELLGTNVPSFLYQTAMSISDTAVGGAMLGTGYSLVAGSSAFQQKAKELTEAGASQGQVLTGAFLSGGAEMLFEHISLDKLLKIKGVDGWRKGFKETFKQAGIEASEELATELANLFSDQVVRGNTSELKQMYDDFIERGYTEDEAKSEIWKVVNQRIGEAAMGGFLSGGALGSVQSVRSYSQNKNIGSQIKGNERTEDLLGNMTEDESEAYKLYTEYANKGINAENIKDAQLGNIYTTMYGEAKETLDNKKATNEERENAKKKLDSLEHVIGERTEKEKALKKEQTEAKSRATEMNIGAESMVSETGDAIRVKGIKSTEDGTVIVTDNGEVALTETTLTGNDAMLVAYAENMGETKGSMFISNYDEQMDVHQYFKDFTEVYDRSANGFSQDIVLRNKGTLSETQVGEIYKSTIITANKERQTFIDNLNAKSSKNFISEGKFNDSVIDYDSKTTDGSKVNWNSLNQRQREAITFMQGMSKALGINIVLEKEGKQKRYNGWYSASENAIHIDVYAGMESMNDSDTIIPVFSHELTHWMKQKTPQMYQKMMDYALETIDIASHGSVEAYVEAERKRLDDRHAKKDGSLHESSEAMDEILARACEDMLTNSKSVKEFMSRLTETEQKSFIDKVKKMFKDILTWVDDMLSQYKGQRATSEEAKLLRRYKDRFEEMSAMWDKALAEAVKTNENMKPEDVNETLNDLGLYFDEESETVFSYRSLEDQFNMDDAEDFVKTKEEYIQALMKATKRNRKMCENYLNSLFLVHDMIGNDRARLDYEAAINKSAWVSNAEYGGSVDFSTLCAKRRLFTGTMDAIIEQLPNTVLTDTDFLDIRNRLLAKELESPCSMCYVEGSRAKNSIYINNWLTEYKKTNPKWIPQLADFTSTVRLEKTRLQHPEAYKSYQEAMNKLAQRKPKEASVRTDYKGEIKIAFNDGSSVDIKNKNGGIRFNSFSDFEIIHALDCMQVVTDMATVGLAGQGYTKVKEFAECFGNTGMKINLSVVAKGVDKNGNLIFDEVNGMKYAEALDLRTRYSKNVGIVIVVFNNDQLKSALRDGTIDYVLPFHRSQWRKAQYSLMGLPTQTKDYTSHQNDRIRNPKTGRPVKLSKIKHVATYTNDITGETFEIKDNIMPNQYWDYNQDGVANANRYLGYINANKMTPKFAFLLSKDADGNWVLPTDKNGNVTEEGKGYFKLLIDFKMYDNDGVGSPQNPVVPDFNMPYINNMLENYMGGHESFPVAHDVADSFVEDYKKKHKQKQYSDRDSDGNQLTEEQIEFFKDSKVRDYNGHLKVVYHSTDSNFYVFDKNKIGSGNGGANFGKGFYFSADEDLSSNYGGNTGKYYLNIKNPYNYYSTDKDYIVDMLEKSEVEYDKEFVDNYDFDYLFDDDFIDDFLSVALKGKDVYAEFSNMVQKAGYDGIWADNEIVAFNSNQIKSVANTNPTEDADIRYSDREIIGPSGKNYGIGVYLDSNLLTGLTDAERIEMVKEFVVSELAGTHFIAYDNNNDAVDIGIAKRSDSVKKQNGKKRKVLEELYKKYSKSVIKQEAVVLVDELIANATYDTSKKSAYAHDWLDDYGKNDWDYWKVYIQEKNKTVWEAILNIANTTNGEKILYDINPIKKAEGSVKSDPSSTTNSIPLSEQNATESSEENEQFSDRDNGPYRILDEEYRLEEENKALREDIKALKYILQIERDKNFKNSLDESKLKSAAKYLLNKVDSKYDRTEFEDGMREIFLYIGDAKQLDANIVMSKCNELARRVMAKSSSFQGKNAYIEKVLKDLNKVDVANIENEWQGLSEKYPKLFPKDTKVEDMATEFNDTLNTVQATSDMYKSFNKDQARISLATEIYNQYWNVATTDLKDKEIQRLRLDHRKQMDFIRDKHRERMQNQRLADAMHYGKVIEKVKQKDKEKLKKVREADAKRQKAQNLKADITRKALTLNRWLKHNSHKEHIPEGLQPIVAKFLNALDFSSKRYIDTGGQDYTKSDMYFAEALRQVHEMMRESNDGAIGVEGAKYYGLQFSEGDIKTIGQLVKSVNEMVSNGRLYVLNQLTVEELQVLDDMVSMLKKGIEDVNKFHTIKHNEGIANMGQNAMVEMNALGQIQEHDGARGWFEKMMNFKNKTPFYAFKMFGEWGLKTFEAFQDGWDKFAFNVKQVIEFTKGLYTSKEVRAWKDEVKTFSHRGKSVKITTPQLMALYCLSKRTQALKHILKGGVHIADFTQKGKVVAQNFTVHFTEAELNNLFKRELTARQIEVADKMQEFMNTVCAEWGNEVTMELYGINQFGKEDFYFPIKSDPENLNKDEKQVAQENPFFRLLNMSFTKPLEDDAENRIMVLDIFEVFSAHASDMAKYNALALPVIDTYKLLNYKEKVPTSAIEHDVHSLKRSLNKAFGKSASSYIYTFLKDLNGAENTSRDSAGSKFMSYGKIAAVGGNLRVALLQPTAYFKAGLVMNPKYLANALGHKKSTLKRNYERALKYCGMVTWKSMGFYDTSISRGLLSQITHDESFRDKAVEVAMMGTANGDMMTLAYLWTACESEIRNTRPNLKVDTEEFYQAIGNRLREVIYATQVVDATVTRSEMMRGSGMYDKMLTAFASEPTLSLNMLQDAFVQYKLTERRQGKEVAKKKHKKDIRRAMSVYAITGLATSIVGTLIDILRDTEDEKEAEDIWKVFFDNLNSDLSILGKIPYLKELKNAFEGFSSSRMDTQWMEQFAAVYRDIQKFIEGDGNAFKTVKDILKVSGSLVGFPFYNVYRDLLAIGDWFGLEAEDLEEMMDDIG